MSDYKLETRKSILRDYVVNSSNYKDCLVLQISLRKCTRRTIKDIFICLAILVERWENHAYYVEKFGEKKFKSFEDFVNKRFFTMNRYIRISVPKRNEIIEIVKDCLSGILEESLPYLFKNMNEVKNGSWTLYETL